MACTNAFATASIACLLATLISSSCEHEAANGNCARAVEMTTVIETPRATDNEARPPAGTGRERAGASQGVRSARAGEGLIARNLATSSEPCHRAPKDPCPRGRQRRVRGLSRPPIPGRVTVLSRGRADCHDAREGVTPSSPLKADAGSRCPSSSGIACPSQEYYSAGSAATLGSKRARAPWSVSNRKPRGSARKAARSGRPAVT